MCENGLRHTQNADTRFGHDHPGAIIRIRPHLTLLHRTLILYNKSDGRRRHTLRVCLPKGILNRGRPEEKDKSVVLVMDATIIEYAKGLML